MTGLNIPAAREHMRALWEDYVRRDPGRGPHQIVLRIEDVA